MNLHRGNAIAAHWPSHVCRKLALALVLCRPVPSIAVSGGAAVHGACPAVLRTRAPGCCMRPTFTNEIDVREGRAMSAEGNGIPGAAAGYPRRWPAAVVMI